MHSALQAPLLLPIAPDLPHSCSLRDGKGIGEGAGICRTRPALVPQVGSPCAPACWWPHYGGPSCPSRVHLGPSEKAWRSLHWPFPWHRQWLPPRPAWPLSAFPGPCTWILGPTGPSSSLQWPPLGPAAIWGQTAGKTALSRSYRLELPLPSAFSSWEAGASLSSTHRMVSVPGHTLMVSRALGAATLVLRLGTCASWGTTCPSLLSQTTPLSTGGSVWPEVSRGAGKFGSSVAWAPAPHMDPVVSSLWAASADCCHPSHPSSGEGCGGASPPLCRPTPLPLGPLTFSSTAWVGSWWLDVSPTWRQPGPHSRTNTLLHSPTRFYWVKGRPLVGSQICRGDTNPVSWRWSCLIEEIL